MLPNHATQTDPYLHECKGASTATAGQVVTANGDGTATFQSPVSGGSGSVVKTQAIVSTTLLTSAVLIPFDNTIPQIGEGLSVFSAAFTPSTIGNKIRVEAQVYGAYSVASHVVAAMFQDTTADALAAVSVQTTTTNQDTLHTLIYEFTASSTSSTTISVRVGGASAGTYTFNGNAGASIFGGVATSTLRITEIKA